MSTASLPPAHPDRPEENIPAYDLASVPEEALDNIPADEVLPSPTHNPSDPAGVLPLPAVVLGCAPFGYGIYADMDDVTNTMPVRIVRAALRAGINAFDTAPHYHPSEIILGKALDALRSEFPRESYSIVTKTAKYGPKMDHHLYDAETTRKSLDRSLKRLHTDYLDVVYLHDVEYVVDSPHPSPAGMHLDALGPDAAAWHLDPPYVAQGPGDESILETFAVLREYQAAGKIKRVGLASFPLPVLLRLCLLILERTGQPVDIIQTYCHQTILCSTLEEGYLAAFTDRAKVPQVVNAAPLSMGILTTSGGPAWHPARSVDKVWNATREAVELCKAHGTTLEAVAVAFGYRTLRQDNGAVVPVVVGCTNLEQLHQTLQTYAQMNGGTLQPEVAAAEKAVRKLFEERGVLNWSWEKPSPEDFE